MLQEVEMRKRGQRGEAERECMRVETQKEYGRWLLEGSRQGDRWDKD